MKLGWDLWRSHSGEKIRNDVLRLSPKAVLRTSIQALHRLSWHFWPALIMNSHRINSECMIRDYVHMVLNCRVSFFKTDLPWIESRTKRVYLYNLWTLVGNHKSLFTINIHNSSLPFVLKKEHHIRSGQGGDKLQKWQERERGSLCGRTCQEVDRKYCFRDRCSDCCEMAGMLEGRDFVKSPV